MSFSNWRRFSGSDEEPSDEYMDGPDHKYDHGEDDYPEHDPDGEL